MNVRFRSHNLRYRRSGSFGSEGAVLQEPCARLVARMFTFWAKEIA
ncbi:hypothetical protein GOB34_17830 [Sinorhizobium meliloti]|nr:hypothetical protein [Sinorhizobium meliloti]